MLSEAVAEIWRCSDSAYFADFSAVSNSMLSAFARSPALYHGRYVTRTIPDDVTDAMRRGSAFHKAMEYHGVSKVPYVACPEVDRRTKLGKETYADHVALSDELNLPLVMHDEADAIKGMVASVTSHPIGSMLLKHSAHREVALRWHDPETGILCKAKPDLISDCRVGGKRVVVDYKSALDPYPDVFGRSMANFGYHRQAAHYGAGCETVFGEEFAWLLVVVGAEPPHETFVYQIDPGDLARGQRERRRLMADLNRRIDSGDWAHSASGVVTTVALPKWSKEQEGDE